MITQRARQLRWLLGRAPEPPLNVARRAASLAIPAGWRVAPGGSALVRGMHVARGSPSSRRAICRAARQAPRGGARAPRARSSATSAAMSPPSRPRQARADVEEDEAPSGADEFEEKWGTGLPLPRPPAGFVLGDDGAVALMAPAERRVLTLSEPGSGKTLECHIRRIFTSSAGLLSYIALPLDTPIQIWGVREGDKSLYEPEDDEVDAVLPDASYALAKKHMHLQNTAFCLTARGALCYTAEAVVDINADGSDLRGDLSEGVEITGFHVRGREYLIYTPFSPLLFVACQTPDGAVVVADEELLGDPKVEEALEEEEEFNFVAEEEEGVRDAVRAAK